MSSLPIFCNIVLFEYTSGTSIKYRSITSHLANKEIMANLNMAAKASIASDPEIKTYYERRKLVLSCKKTRILSEIQKSAA